MFIYVKQKSEMKKVKIYAIDLVTVFDAILTSRQTREKLQ